VIARLSRLVVVAALTCSLGLHWAMLQSVAWVSMVVTYSQESPLKEAVAKTFDGKHPCPLCKEIAKGKQSERRHGAGIVVKKLEGASILPRLSLVPPVGFSETRWPSTEGARLANAPLLPPPKHPAV
jgi:hypothetical protein